MRTCPNCTTSTPDDSQFCSRCGAILQSAIPGTSPASSSFPAQTSADGPTSEKATASLIFGILSYIILPLIGAIPAIILGHLALSEIRKSAGRLKGHGMAVAGMVLGYVQFSFIPFVLIIAAIAIPNLLRAKMAANEASAVGALRSYSFALGTYVAQCPQSGFPPALENLGPGGHDCERSQLLDGVLANSHATRSGYAFYYRPDASDSSGPATGFSLSAEPLTPGTTGVRHFFTDQTGVIRVNQSGPADSSSPPLP